jgi:hypothetical protein
MTLSDITASMKRYNDIITDGYVLVDFFSQGTYFEYAKPDNMENSSDIHAYPGITEDKKLVFYVIPSEYDVESTPHIETHVKECYLIHLLEGGHPLPDNVAQEMCNCWDNNYQTWIPDEVKQSKTGMFKAFIIPADDFISPVVRVNLALKMKAAAATDMVADVVVTNFEGTNVYNYDFADTVPPIPADQTNNFYLLSLV